MKKSGLFITHSKFLIASLLFTGGLISGCQDKESAGSDVTGRGVRLKHLTAQNQVSALLAAEMQGYAIQGVGNFTDEGNYPAMPHIYSYTVAFKKDMSNYVYAWRSINAQTGMGKETKDEILGMFADMEEITDKRLGRAPYENVFALRYRKNEKEDWQYSLYIRLAEINNQDNQVISLKGTFGPVTSNPEYEAIAPEPVDSRTAVSAMLALTEPIP